MSGPEIESHRERRLFKRRQQRRARQARETESQHQERLQKERDNRQIAENRQRRVDAQRERQARLRWLENDEQRQARLKADTERRARRRYFEDDEQRQARLEAQRERQVLRRRLEDDEEREARLEADRKRRARHRWLEDRERREGQLKAERERREGQLKAERERKALQHSVQDDERHLSHETITKVKRNKRAEVDNLTNINVNMYTIAAQDKIINSTRNVENVDLTRMIFTQINKTGVLPKQVKLFIGSKVKLCSDVDTGKGLVNGKKGEVIEILWPYCNTEYIPSVRINFGDIGIHEIKPMSVQFRAKHVYGTAERRMLPLISCFS